MGESKITPWPWRHGGCVVYGGDGGFVADLVMRGRRPADETEANACLIAAAPELLDVALGVLAALSYPRGSEAQIRCLEEIGQDAQAAIAKAKGDD